MRHFWRTRRAGNLIARGRARASDTALFVRDHKEPTLSASLLSLGPSLPSTCPTFHFLPHLSPGPSPTFYLLLSAFPRPPSTSHLPPSTTFYLQGSNSECLAPEPCPPTPLSRVRSCIRVTSLPQCWEYGNGLPTQVVRQRLRPTIHPCKQGSNSECLAPEPWSLLPPLSASRTHILCPPSPTPVC